MLTNSLDQDIIYFNRTFTPCDRYFRSMMTYNIMFKDTLKYGNLSLDCPLKKVSFLKYRNFSYRYLFRIQGFTYLKGFTMDTQMFPSILPLDIKTYFKIIGKVARPVKKAIRLTEVFKLSFLGKLVNNQIPTNTLKHYPVHEIIS